MQDGPHPDTLLRVVRAATGRPHAELGPWEVAPSAHRLENMTTEALDHVTGALGDGTRWAVFAKTLRPASASPIFPMIPIEFHQQVLTDLHWLDEATVYRSGLADHLPPGLRMPSVWAIDEGADRLVLWLEHVDDAGPWDLARYERSARALGRLAGRWPEARVAAQLGLGRRSYRSLFHGKVTHADLPALADDATWARPAVTALADPDLRADLAWLAGVAPALLDGLDRLPHALAHGDASPANLLEPGDGTVVAVDWSYGSIGAVGSDLAQLLAGRFESGEAEVDELPAIADALAAGYRAGLADEGAEVSRADLDHAWATTIAVRSAFSALLVDQRDDLDEAQRADLVRRRAGLARFAVDLARQVLAVPDRS